jgi:hypothetical protein
MMNVCDLNKKLFAAVLLAFMASAMLPACSSSDEAAQEDDVQSEVCDEMGANQSGGCL